MQVSQSIINLPIFAKTSLGAKKPVYQSILAIFRVRTVISYYDASTLSSKWVFYLIEGPCAGSHSKIICIPFSINSSKSSVLTNLLHLIQSYKRDVTCCNLGIWSLKWLTNPNNFWNSQAFIASIISSDLVLLRFLLLKWTLEIESVLWQTHILIFFIIILSSLKIPKLCHTTPWLLWLWMSEYNIIVNIIDHEILYSY